MFCTRRKVRGKKRNGTKTSRFLDKDSNKKGSSEKILELVFKHSHSFHDRERAFELRKTVFLISKIDPPGKCIVNFRVKKTRRFFVCDTFFFRNQQNKHKTTCKLDRRLPRLAMALRLLLFSVCVVSVLSQGFIPQIPREVPTRAGIINESPTAGLKTSVTETRNKKLGGGATVFCCSFSGKVSEKIFPQPKMVTFSYFFMVMKQT